MPSSKFINVSTVLKKTLYEVYITECSYAFGFPTCMPLINIVIITSCKNATHTTISHRDNNNWETVSYEEMHLKGVYEKFH